MFIGFVIGVVVTLLAVYGFYRYVVKKFSPRLYEVVGFSREKNEDGTYDVAFQVADDYVASGYTKKMIPSELNAEDIRCVIRSYHATRGKYRVFWIEKTRKYPL